MRVIREARFDQLDARTLYQLLRLRVDVFVVEQACPYPELDGRDTEPGARHCWVEAGGEVVACVRLLAEPEGTSRIGRVATARHARGRGHAAALMRHVLATTPGQLVLDAQTYLAGWYEGFGFHPTGPEFDEDGISHVPMRLAR